MKNCYEKKNCILNTDATNQMKEMLETLKVNTSSNCSSKSSFQVQLEIRHAKFHHYQ